MLPFLNSKIRNKDLDNKHIQRLPRNNNTGSILVVALATTTTVGAVFAQYCQ
jgi:hypothetical protein